MDMENKIKDICSMQETIISCLKSSVDGGLSNVDTDEAGKVADIIKDFSQTEKYFWEAKYYKLVCKAMEEKSDVQHGSNYGYSPRVTGTYRMGYKPYLDQEPYIKGYLHDPDFENNMRQGYNEYGMPYTEYMTARRHYSESKSMTDRTQMDTHAKEHIDQTIETIEDIWEDATPELKLKMKAELKALYDSMTM